MQTTPLDMVIAVDESASLSSEDVVQEIAATSTIAQAVLNPKSRVTVIGFGSNNGGPNQVAARQVCRPTLVDSEMNRQYLASCVKDLHLRTAAEGADTDHVAALSKSLSALYDDSPVGALKVVFLLTDGKLDVPNSPNYGDGDRNAEARTQLALGLKRAKDTKVQIWPLGFGSGVQQSALDKFSEGGSQDGCDPRSESRPKARVVRDSRDVLRSLSEVYALATCSGLSQTDSTTLEKGQQRDLKIAIPVIATDGTITVTKGDPKIRVDYLDPSGTAVGASSGESTFTRSGENTATESLRIVNPVNGVWTVRLSAPEAMGKQLVSATALWQGAVRASILVDPPSAQIGQNLVVRLSLITRTGALTDANALRGLDFNVVASGVGLTAPRKVPVHDDGKAPDDVKNDGRFAGEFTAPNEVGTLSFTGEVSGVGLHAEQVPVTVQVTSEKAGVEGHVAFVTDGHVNPGATVKGKITTRNATGSAQRAVLTLDGAGPARAAVAPGTAVELPPGDSAHDFSVTFGADAKLGGTSLTLRLVGESDPASVYANGLLTVTIEEPPTWAQRHRWWIVGALVLLLATVVGLWLRRRAWRSRVNARGLVVSLNRDGERVGRELKAPTRWSREFRFTIHNADGRQAALGHYQPGSPRYTASRGRDGVVVRTPQGEMEISFGSDGQPLEGGLMLAFRDERPRRTIGLAKRKKKKQQPRRRPDPRRDGHRDGHGHGDGPQDGGRTEQPPPGGAGRTTPDLDDPWL
ncbi:VWA domain-containing protein [Actinocorallia longicatena]|uniref:VWA domain-containing protein n=1 Tax=Actinocorallia longicatena TaxID=111803 RepID=UPI0031DE14FE